MVLDEDIRKAIESVIHDRFDDAQIVSIDVKAGDEYEDDMLVYVTVVFDATAGLDTGKTVSITRHTRDRLREYSGTPPFPVYRFISSDDERGQQPAVA
ncbi:hypothetical protein [Caulobacter sp. NIBR2454]|uniref:hypothetical protein n=1 Tax=Caulobacter sp. NIBR2454 TaxID=3015996 RepID=UPI0022B666D0|nr:hypothetical protein [Caulobacter sp. NIBR2454]